MRRKRRIYRVRAGRPPPSDPGHGNQSTHLAVYFELLRSHHNIMQPPPYSGGLAPRGSQSFGAFNEGMIGLDGEDWRRTRGDPVKAIVDSFKDISAADRAESISMEESFG